MNDYKTIYYRWLNSPKVDEETKTELRAIENLEEEIKFRFFTSLSFGTAGLRGLMQAGTNAMNVYTVAQATEGLSRMIVDTGAEAMKRGVVIAYDCRNHSRSFAECAACVLAAHGIRVYLFDALRPTPLLSYAIGKLNCFAGINITASHNPKCYNGYKAYAEDGAQLSTPLAKKVAEYIAATDIFDDVQTMSLKDALDSGIVTYVPSSLDEAYLSEVLAQRIDTDAVSKAADDLRIVYTPLHGTGYRLVPEILSRIGIRHLHCVEEQMRIDGNFPTVETPNPEYASVFELGISLADRVGSDLIVATDPDADRVGIAVRRGDGKFITLTGNQTGVLLLDYIITALKRTNRLPADAYAVKSIVTTRMADRVCEVQKVPLYDVYTGFRFIGEKIRENENAGKKGFLFAFEESYGYLRGKYARDKDAVVATMLICEMAAFYRAKNMTLLDALQKLYKTYGYYEDGVENIYMEGLDGLEKMKALMQCLRKTPPKEIGGIRVSRMCDYLSGRAVNLEDGSTDIIGMQPSDVLSFDTAAGDTIVIRPSGTEPKIKIYFLTSGKTAQEASEKTEAYRADAKTWAEAL